MSELGRRSSAAATDRRGDGDDAAVRDRRLLRGAHSRRAILRHAVDVASMEGLTGLSFGRLASDLGLSKSGVQTLFGSKENLQTAAAEFAREVFGDAVVRPALAVPHGAGRLRALIERWIGYAGAPLFPGGCFWVANLADFDSRPGRVRDMLVRHQEEWRGLIAAELRHAAETAEIANLDVELAAFQIDAVLVAANIDLRLGDDKAVQRVRRVTEQFLAPAA